MLYCAPVTRQLAHSMTIITIRQQHHHHHHQLKKFCSIRTVSSMNSITTSLDHHDSFHSHQINDVYIALGSNQDDRSFSIHRAFQELKQLGTIIATSYLYETTPMYIEDQDKFLNAVCLLRTSTQPMILLDRLKDIENKLGRLATYRNGPRVIDLDILLYGNHCISNDRLTIPHPRMQERPFVLKPLCDINPSLLIPQLSSNTTTNIDESSSSSNSNRTIHELYEALLPISNIYKVFPVYNYFYGKTRYIPSIVTTNTSSSPPLIMGILNLTPDRYIDYIIYNFESIDQLHAHLSIWVRVQNIITKFIIIYVYI
jgi:2-amino-4-hydroxy-6-hydroxymethyldihydropteridine diphosphokinase